MHKQALITGLICAGLGVVIGAFAAHGLKPRMDLVQQQTFETGVRYQMYHSFALIALALIGAHFPGEKIHWAFICFTLGIICFSGSLYALALLKMNGKVGLGGIGIITPIGGLFFILGWLFTLLSVLQQKNA
ncbi:DUF423 domain-containing protein [Rurimicrobium arvi]|uniref:DUF423 domain-containing protein n=1 Tax=Rurimicrobium arvi TaxID=2049916 RepID=A0ABP8MRE9_9BACT